VSCATLPIGLRADTSSIAAGAFCTLFLARPNPELTEVPRWPKHIKTPDICVVCNTKEGDPLECERCDMPYHLGCIDPPLDVSSLDPT
jgi:hypothetical protein